MKSALLSFARSRHQTTQAQAVTTTGRQDQARLTGEELPGQHTAVLELLPNLLNILDSFWSVDSRWPLWDRRRNLADTIMNIVVVEVAPHS